MSHSFHQLLAQLNPALAGRFHAHTLGDAQPVRLYVAPVQRAMHDDDTRQMDIMPAELDVIEHTLERFVGDPALALVSGAIERCTTLQDFVATVAAGIEHPQQREVFLQALSRALPARSF